MISLGIVLPKNILGENDESMGIPFLTRIQWRYIGVWTLRKHGLVAKDVGKKMGHGSKCWFWLQWNVSDDGWFRHAFLVMTGFRSCHKLSDSYPNRLGSSGLFFSQGFEMLLLSSTLPTGSQRLEPYLLFSSKVGVLVIYLVTIWSKKLGILGRFP